jgi:hypothetical protein
MVIQKGNNDFLIEFLKIERREENGRERKIKDRCFSSGGVKKPVTALQLLRKQGRRCLDPNRDREEKDETRLLRRLIRTVSCGRVRFVAGNPSPHTTLITKVFPKKHFSEQAGSVIFLQVKRSRSVKSEFPSKRS